MRNAHDNFRIVQLGRVTDPEAGPPDYVPVGDRFVLPERFYAVIEPDDPALPRCHVGFVVERGRPVCAHLHCERRDGGPPITGEALRQLPLAAYTKSATERVAQRLVPDPAGEGVRSIRAYPAPDRDPDDWTDDGHPVWDYGAGATRQVPPEEQFGVQYARLTRSPRRRGPLREDELREIASAYRGALAVHDPPTRAVAARFGVSRSTAGRWIAEARRRGLLGKARPRVAGVAGKLDESGES